MTPAPASGGMQRTRPFVRRSVLMIHPAATLESAADGGNGTLVLLPRPRGPRSGPGDIMARVRRLPRLLCALGVTAVALGGVGHYVTRALFDPDEFASRAASSLRDPRVSAFVATEISDAAIRQRPDLIAVRPLLVGVSEGIVSSEAGQALARRAARAVHQGLLSEGGRDVLLSIPDVGILLQSALASANPQLAAKVPKQVSELGVSLQKTRAG